MAKKKSSRVQQVVDQYGQLLGLLEKEDFAAVKKGLSALSPDDRQGLLGQAIGGTLRVSTESLSWLIENVGVSGDKGYAMTTALLVQKFDLLPLLHAAGFTLDRSDMIANKMVAALAEGSWPHPDLLWPNVIDACTGDHAWIKLVGPSRSISRPMASEGLSVEHLAKIEDLAHTSRPPKNLSSSIAMLGWEGPGAAALIFSQDSHRQALGWMYTHGWIDQAQIEAVGSDNTQWKVHMGEVLDFIRVQGQARALDETTPGLGDRPGRPRF